MSDFHPQWGNQINDSGECHTKQSDVWEQPTSLLEFCIVEQERGVLQVQTFALFTICFSKV